MRYIVTYDLNKAGQDYKDLINAIKKFPHDHVLMSAWLIKSTSTASEIYNHLAQFIDKNDYIIVAELNQNRQGWLKQASWDFLNS